MVGAARGPLLALVATVAGIGAGARLAPGPGRGALTLAAVSGLAAIVIHGSRAASALLALLALAAFACASTARAADGLVSPPDTTGVGTWQVELVDEPVPWSYETSAVVRVEGRRVLAVAGRPVSSHLAVVEAGDRLVVRGRLGPLEDEEVARWHHRHVGARLDVHDVMAVEPTASPLFRVANAVRRLVLSGTQWLPPPEQGLVAGFLVGDTRAVPDDVADDFRAAGLSHLLAVSGANVALVLGALAPVLGRVERKGRFAGAVVVLLLFATVTRFEPSVLRASAMAGLAALATYLGRPAAGLRLLALAVTGLLLVDPFLLESLGFRLSCAATAGILLWSGRIGARLPGPTLVRDTLAVTAAAQLGVAPVLLPAFGGLPLAALPANLLAVPLAAPLTAWGLVSGVVSGVTAGWVPELATLVQAPTFLLARGVRVVAALAAAVPGTVDTTVAWGLVCIGGLVGSLVSGPTGDDDGAAPDRAP